MNILPKRKLRIFSPLIFFSVIVFLISLHDGIISYVTPVILNNRYSNTLFVGSILSISSFFGIFFNFFITKFFPNKGYKFFTFWMLVFAITTALILIFIPKYLFPLVIAMITWSTYYEFRNYSKYNFVEKFLPPNKNAHAWSTMSIFQSLAYMIGPAIAVYLFAERINSSLLFALLMTSLASVLFLFFETKFGKKKDDEKSDREIRSLFDEVKVTHVLTRKIWPLVTFSFALTLLDASFWTIGVLFSESLRSQHPAGGLFLTMYGLPAILTGLAAPRIYSYLGKKRTAFLAGIFAGVLMVCISLLKNVYLTLGMVFLIAFFSGIAFILIYATFEDYITRLDGDGNNMVSIGQISQNIAYVLGPIFFGMVSKDGNYGHSFIAAGEILIFFSVLALVTVPRKIKMPHKEIANIIEKVLDEI